MNHLIDIAGITTLGTIGTIATLTAAAINPIGAGLILAGAVMWARKSKGDVTLRQQEKEWKLTKHWN